MAGSPNPYTPGQIPRVLAGRTAERALLRDRLGRVASFGEFGGPLLTFHAPRGLGKTSLLRASERDAAEVGFITVWVAASRGGSLLAELAHATGRSLNRTDALRGTAARRWETTSRSFGAELGLPGAKVSTSLTQESVAARAPAPISALEELLTTAAAAVVAAGGAGVVVFLDELHAATTRELAVLLNALQNIDGVRETSALAVFGAGLPSTPEALTRAATFGERSTFVELHRLSAQDSATALIEPAEALGVTWDPDAVRQVFRGTGGYPYFLQLVGSAIWDAVAPTRGSSIAVSDVPRGFPAAAEQLRAVYRARWKAASPHEQDFMAAMARSGGEAVPRAAIARALGRDSRALSTPRDRLIEKGVVEPAGHGQLRFTLPGFGAYVLEELGGGTDLTDYVFGIRGQ